VCVASHSRQRRPEHDLSVTFISPGSAVAGLLAVQQRLTARRGADEPMSLAASEFAAALSSVRATICARFFLMYCAGIRQQPHVYSRSARPRQELIFCHPPTHSRHFTESFFCSQLHHSRACIRSALCACTFPKRLANFAILRRILNFNHAANHADVGISDFLRGKGFEAAVTSCCSSR
jgi:hypothetical protein